MTTKAHAPLSTPSSHDFDPVILREYDIRGRIGENLGEADAFALGCAFATLIRRRGGSRVSVGYDGRDSSPALAQALTRGLAATGVDVENIGLGPTPMLYFAVKDRLTDGGIMITGSHNPKNYNGFKMLLQTGPVFGDVIRELGQIAAAGDFEPAAAPGQIHQADIRDIYVERLLRDFTGKRPLKIAWDNGNGAAGEILRRLTARLPGEHILLYDEIDGRFPHHHPDPTVDANLADLRRAVMENGCDLGLAFDGDGDRIGAVDEQGNILRCDILMTIYAKSVLEDHPGAVIIGDVKCSQVMFDAIAGLGGTPVMWNTGHSLVKAKMAQENAPLAGELSGHIFFADKYYGFDDALYCAVRLLNELDEADGPLSSLVAHLPKPVSTPEIRIEVREEEKFELVPRLIEDLQARESESFQISTIDGVRVTTPQGWWLLRPSNTQDVLVARVEAQNQEDLDKLQNDLAKLVAMLGYSMPS